MLEPSVVYVRHSGERWYVQARSRRGLYWYDSEDEAVQEALLWACFIQPVKVVRVDGSKKDTIAEYGIAPARAAAI